MANAMSFSFLLPCFCHSATPRPILQASEVKKFLCCRCSGQDRVVLVIPVSFVKIGVAVFRAVQFCSFLVVVSCLRLFPRDLV